MYAHHLFVAKLFSDYRLNIDRQKRVKDAQEEANKEIEEYKKMKEAEFAEFSKSVCGVLRSLLLYRAHS